MIKSFDGLTVGDRRKWNYSGEVFEIVGFEDYCDMHTGRDDLCAEVIENGKRVGYDIERLKDRSKPV